MPDPEKLTAVREALPALAAGIYLNTGSVGPLPAETAAAMTDIANYERDLGRAHPDYFIETLARMAEARAGVAAVLGTDVAAVGLTHSTTDGMKATLDEAKYDAQMEKLLTDLALKTKALRDRQKKEER